MKDLIAVGPWWKTRFVSRVFCPEDKMLSDPWWQSTKDLESATRSLLNRTDKEGYPAMVYLRAGFELQCSGAISIARMAIPALRCVSWCDCKVQIPQKLLASSCLIQRPACKWNSESEFLLIVNYQEKVIINMQMVMLQPRSRYLTFSTSLMIMTDGARIFAARNTWQNKSQLVKLKQYLCQELCKAKLMLYISPQKSLSIPLECFHCKYALTNLPTLTFPCMLRLQNRPITGIILAYPTFE